MDWYTTFKNHDAIWEYDPNKPTPHPLLQIRMHANAFFNGRIVGQNPDLLRDVCGALLPEIRKRMNPVNIDWVIGPAMRSITFAYELARLIADARSFRCRAGYAEKDPSGNMSIKSFGVLPGDNVLLVDDAFTTGQTLEKAAGAVRTLGGIVMPKVIVMVEWIQTTTEGSTCNGHTISLVQAKMNRWPAHSCPLCNLGSTVVHPPEEPTNWAKLTKRQ